MWQDHTSGSRTSVFSSQFCHSLLCVSRNLLAAAYASIIHIILAENISAVKCMCSKRGRDHNCQCIQVDPLDASSLSCFTRSLILQVSWVEMMKDVAGCRRVAVVSQGFGYHMSRKAELFQSNLNGFYLQSKVQIPASP